jgi:hypothetical protein
MPKGDIELPNLSGTVDPTIKDREATQRMHQLQQRFDARARSRPAQPAVSRGIAGRLVDSYRQMKGRR